jgi:hypothetical protein
LLSKEQIEKRVETLAAFITMVEGKGIVNNIITMDEGAVSMHTPEIKRNPCSASKRVCKSMSRLRVK